MRRAREASGAREGKCLAPTVSAGFDPAKPALDRRIELDGPDRKPKVDGLSGPEREQASRPWAGFSPRGTGAARQLAVGQEQQAAERRAERAVGRRRERNGPRTEFSLINFTEHSFHVFCSVFGQIFTQFFYSN